MAAPLRFRAPHTARAGMFRNDSRGLLAVAANDLSTPLGQKRKQIRFALPFRITDAIAGVLGLCLLVFVGWALFATNPYGGEPIVIVAADARGAPAAKPGAPGDAAATPGEPSAPAPASPGEPSAAEKSPAPNGQTVTIIDGMSGKRQEVAIPPSDGKPQAPAIDQRLIETTRHGTIPKIASDGARPAEIYARPLAPTFEKVAGPRVAIVVDGLGVSAAATFDALAKLPSAVTLAFAPYGTDLARWVARARGEGHEVLLQVPMEPFDYPDNDPGPQTLLTTLSPTQNLDRLHWFMSRFQGYVGIANYMGARFTANENAIGPLLREVAKRGLVYFDDGSSPRSVAN